MQQERGEVRDSSTQGRTTALDAPSVMPHAPTLNAVSAGKADVSGPTDQQMVAQAEQLALRVRVKSREAVG
jgi:hypothetical protein